MNLNKIYIPVALEGPGTVMRTKDNFGGMTVCINELPKGTDFILLLEGLDSDSCHCPNWGFVLNGKLRMYIPHSACHIFCNWAKGYTN